METRSLDLCPNGREALAVASQLRRNLEKAGQVPVIGLVVPYGVYDIAQDAGMVSVGIDNDTAQFAVSSALTATAALAVAVTPRPPLLQRHDHQPDHEARQRGDVGNRDQPVA